MTYLTLFRVTEFRNAFLIRGMVVWGGLRLATLVLPSGPLPVAAQLFLLLVVALAVWVDARRRNETLFLANLGIPSSTVAGSAALLPTSLELLLL